MGASEAAGPGIQGLSSLPADGEAGVRETAHYRKKPGTDQPLASRCALIANRAYSGTSNRPRRRRELARGAGSGGGGHRNGGWSGDRFGAVFAP